MAKEIKYTSAYVIQKLKYRIKYMDYLIQGISMFGVDKFKDSLNELCVFKQLKNEPYSNKDKEKKYFFDNKQDEEIVEFIIDLILKEWKEHNVSRQQLFKGNRRLENAKAKRIAMMLIKRNTTLSDTLIGKYFNRTRQVIFSATKEHKQSIKNKNGSYFKTFKKLNEIVSKKYKIK